MVLPSQDTRLELLARPGDLIPRDVADGNASRGTWYVVGPDPVTWDQVTAVNRLGGQVLSRSVVLNPPPGRETGLTGPSSLGSLSGDGAAVTAVVAGMVLLQIALMAGPAMAVGAGRRLRVFALMAAAGAHPRQLRAVVQAHAVLVGLVTSLVASAAGAGVGVVVVHLLHRFGHTDAPRGDVRVTDLTVLVVTGTLTALAASLVPARQVARSDVITALSGRHGQTAPRLRVSLVGFAVALAGSALVAWASVSDRGSLVAVGIALSEIGLVTAVGSVIALAARAGRRLPLAPRLALRDAARHRGRTAPAIAAVMAATAAATAAALYLAYLEGQLRDSYRGPMAVGVLEVSGGGAPLPADVLQKAEAAITAQIPVHDFVTRRELRLPDGHQVTLEAVPPPGQECPWTSRDTPTTPDDTGRLMADPRCSPPLTTHVVSTSAYVDDGPVTRLLIGRTDAAAEAALAAGRIVAPRPSLLWPDGTVHVKEVWTDGDADSQVHTRTVALPGYGYRSGSPVAPANLVIPPSRVADLGLVAHPVGLLARADQIPSGQQELIVMTLLQDLRVTDAQDHRTPDTALTLHVERGYGSRLEIIALGFLVAAAVVALAGTFAAVGLAATERRADASTLGAVGAAPGLRRRLGAAQAGVVAGLGTVLGLAGGALSGMALIQLDRSSPGAGSVRPAFLDVLGVPWSQLGALGLGVPLLAMLFGYLTTRSRLPLQRRLGQ